MIISASCDGLRVNQILVACKAPGCVTISTPKRARYTCAAHLLPPRACISPGVVSINAVGARAYLPAAAPESFSLSPIVEKPMLVELRRKVK